MDHIEGTMRKKARKNAGGFTLAELVTAVAFFSLLFFALFAVLVSANNIFRMQNLNAGINQGGMQLIRSIAREIAESSPATDQSHFILSAPDIDNNNSVQFQVPVDWDNDGDVVQSSLTQTTEWGAYRVVREPQEQSWLSGWVQYRVENNQLLREILQSANGNVLATDIIVPKDVTAFQITQVSTNRYRIVLTIGKEDAIGQKSATARTYQTTFGGNVFVRNGG
jgi:type II secretory pathway component PulJ